ncbi:MAG: Na+/H+ antiporter NhaA [Pseudomonadota bacterium]
MILASTIHSFLKRESSSGILLMAASALAMVFANTSLSEYYDLLLSTEFEVRIGEANIAKPLLLWINDGLMAVFFFLIGLELKREVLEGQLPKVRNVLLPAFGAIGGMLVPSLIYLAFNHQDPIAVNGWAIPAATDIAFALGILSLLGSRVPLSLKIFLTTIAIFDDLGAIIIIALFYTSNISALALTTVAVCLIVLSILNRMHITAKSLYIFIGIIMWIAMLKSGVHATLAGVLLAFFIPMTSPNTSFSPAKTLERDLHTLVAFGILPIFAFANAGISFNGVTMADVLHPIPLGIALGLLVGKVIGVFGFCYAALKLGFASLPKGMDQRSLLGVSALCGIGFTMSLFIGSLAFQQTGVNTLVDERIGILLGSLFSGLLGYAILYTHFKNPSRDEPKTKK